ncbi:hypothetical protein ABD90_14955 [Lysinibacillus fusiformis]|uniref:Uncharacterized protein n=1 Tax=Lysinibacillus sphaericus CBAM5 TaxID=1400869 RepID=W7RIB0_LYSSH|nr:hypothetical protein AR327_03345 [Lysinibacillus sphaericus]EWH31577.1 hypothetical protein P799_18890 [Lysinibacillus sphaericus CBAM5]MBG9726543.1 hypothetical protein [Lysinibacillus fusiformis]AMR89293.1 hypothetical protein A1T07_03325 [Lysinibacillus sphaericus]ANA47364.1 hypothetical protein A2J09_18535 [Lysinibacillus sphaericus]
MIFLKWLQAFFCSLALVVLSVLYAGLLLSGILSILAGFLRTFGFHQIKMSIWYGVELPVIISIPLSLLVAILLFFCAKYVKLPITFCFSKIKS